MNCREFERVHVAALVGDASRAELDEAARHAGECAPCAGDAIMNEQLARMMESEAEKLPKGYSTAQTRLEKTLRERRAYYGWIEAPIGRLHLAKTEHGLCRVSFRRNEAAFERELESRGLLPDYAPARLSREAQELEDYFAGRRTEFDFPLDLRLTTAFQKRVLGATRRVRFGRVASYSDIARRIGKPEARRAVGSALGRNPLPIVIPCHRVVSADGSLGGYTGGTDVKRKLMEVEGIELRGASG